MRKALWLMLAVVTALSALSAAPHVYSAGDLAPNVIDTAPLRGQELPIDGSVTFYFDQPMNRASVDSAFSVSPPIIGRLSWLDDATLTFMPSAPLERDTAYTFIIGTGARSQSGVALRDAFVLRLSTPGALEVTQVLPADGSTGIEATPLITVIFNRPVVPLLPVEEMHTLPVPISISPAAGGQGEWLSTSIYTFRPDGLTGGMQYTVTVNQGLTDVTGSVLEAPFVFRFTTVAPRLIEVQPRENAEGILLEQPIRLTFSQPMDAAATEAAFSLSVRDRTVPGAFTWNDRGTTLTFQPENRLDYNTLHVVRLDRERARSATGAALSQGLTASFRTIPLPDVVNTWPANNRTDTQDSGVTFRFTAPMDLTDFADRVTIEPEPGLRYDDYFDQDGFFYTIAFSHEPSTTYTVTLNVDGLTDRYGTPLTPDTTSRVYDVVDGNIQIRWTTAAYPPEASLRTGGRVGLYSAYTPTTRVFTTHRNIDRINLELSRLSLEEFLRLAARPWDDISAEGASLLRQWTVDVQNPFNVLRYDLLTIAEGPSMPPARIRCEGAPPARLSRGDSVVVLPDDPAPLRVRQSPSLSGSIVATVPINTRLNIPRYNGPRCADGYVWWYVESPDGRISGWVAEGSTSQYFIGLEGASAAVPPATPEPIPDYDRISAEAPALAPGMYLLRMNSPEITTGRGDLDHVMLVATANVTLKVAARTMLAWVTDLDSGLPVPGVPVTFYRGREVGRWPDIRLETESLGAATTDADGLAILTLDAQLDELWQNYYAVLQGERFGIGFTGWESGIEPWNFQQSADYYPQDSTVYLYTDRSLYRTGQPVYFRGVVRSRDDMVYALADVSSVHVQVIDGDGQTIHTASLPLTPYGTFSGSFDIAQDAPLGFYRIVIRPGFTGSDVREYAGPVFERGITVAQYRVPEFQVSVAADHTDVIQGDTIRVNVESTYFFGGAVSGARVEWSAFSEDYYFSYEGEGRYSFFDFNEDEGYRSFRGRFGREVAQGEGMTDAQGRFVIELPADLGDATQSQVFTVEARVIDESDQLIAGRAGVIVHQGEFYIGAGPEVYVGAADQPQQINLITLTWQGTPQPNIDLALRVVERRWSSVQTLEPSTGRTVWNYEVREEPITDGEVRTDAEGRAVFSFAPPRGGVYKVYATSRDDRGNQITTSTFLWVAGPGYVPWRQQNSNRIDLRIDRDNYRVGDTASILIASPFQGEATALVTVERGSILRTEVITLTTNSTIYELPITLDMAPNAFVSVMIVKGVDDTNPVAAFRMGLVQFGVDTEQLALNIEITPDREQAGPRETVSYRVRVTDYQGRPVQAEVGVGLTDAAVLSLMPDTSTPILQHFYAQQGLGVRTGSTLVISVDQQTQQILNTVKGGGGGGPEGGIFEIRQRFIDTPLWSPAVMTDSNGEATISVTLPDQLTTWRLDARAVTLPMGDTGTTLVGQQTFDLISTRPLLIRPVTPRFFVVGDRSTLAAVVNNNTEVEQQVTARIAIDGVTLLADASQFAAIPPLGRARFEWPVQVQDVDTVTVTFFASNADGSLTDAARSAVAQDEAGTLPVLRYEAPETVSTGGVIGAEGGSRVEGITLPRRLNITAGRLDVRLDRSLAASMVDALRTLERYPYRMTEHVISRLLANLATYGTLTQLGLDEPDMRDELAALVSEALQRLYAEQKVDGGWGWFVRDRSDPLVTAWAIIALSEAREQGFTVEDAILNGAVRHVQEYLTRNPLRARPVAWEINRQALLLYALARADAGNFARAVSLFEVREQMNTFARASLAMAFNLIDPANRTYTDALIADLLNRAVVSATGVHWEERLPDWYNWNTNTRTTAIVLKALVQIQPESELIPGVVRWLMTARRADAWETPQETAWSVLALTDYMRATGEFEPDYTFGATLNDTPLAAGQIATPANVRETLALTADIADLRPGELNRLTVDRTAGTGNLYYAASLTAFLPAELIEPLSRGMSITREYRLLSNPDGPPITEARVGDNILVTLTIVAPRNLHYVVITDPIPAGVESVNPELATTSAVGEPPRLELDNPFGRGWGWWWFSGTDLRDDRTVLYATYLPRGTYRYTYTLRGGLAGEYRVLPTTGQETYFPEVYGRGAGMIFTLTPALADEAEMAN